jgi:hypothetical protein
MVGGHLGEGPVLGGSPKSANRRTEQPFYAKLSMGTYQKLVDLRFMLRQASLVHTVSCLIEEKHLAITKTKRQ